MDIPKLSIGNRIQVIDQALPEYGAYGTIYEVFHSRADGRVVQVQVKLDSDCDDLWCTGFLPSEVEPLLERTA